MHGMLRAISSGILQVHIPQLEKYKQGLALVSGLCFRDSPKVFVDNRKIKCHPALIKIRLGRLTGHIHTEFKPVLPLTVSSDESRRY